MKRVHLTSGATKDLIWATCVHFMDDGCPGRRDEFLSHKSNTPESSSKQYVSIIFLLLHNSKYIVCRIRLPTCAYNVVSGDSTPFQWKISFHSNMSAHRLFYSSCVHSQHLALKLISLISGQEILSVTRVCVISPSSTGFQGTFYLPRCRSDFVRNTPLICMMRDADSSLTYCCYYYSLLNNSTIVQYLNNVLFLIHIPYVITRQKSRLARIYY